MITKTDVSGNTANAIQISYSFAHLVAGDIPWQEKTAERYVRRSGYQGGRQTLARKKGGKVCLTLQISQQETYLSEKKRRKGMSGEADIKAGDIPWQEKTAERYVWRSENHSRRHTLARKNGGKVCLMLWIPR